MKNAFVHKSIAMLVFLFSFLACHRTQDSPTFTRSPQEVSLQLCNNLLARQGFMLYDTPDVYALHYAEICAAYAALKVTGMQNQQAIMHRIIEKYDEATPDKIPNSNNHVDANVYGILPLEIYLQTKNEDYFQAGIKYADDQWKNPLPNGLSNQTRYWIDDMYMIGCLQVQAYRATGEMIYLERAALELDAYIKKLQQANGLFFHGPNAPIFWGRGNGWVAAGIAELITELPQTNAHYKSIVKGYKAMMKTLLGYQNESGMWHQVIDEPQSFVETSSTAMFAYAMAVGVNNGILKKDIYQNACINAWNSLLTFLDENGNMKEVCVGTGQSQDVQYYFDRPRVAGDFHGQAPMLWLAGELIAAGY